MPDGFLGDWSKTPFFFAGGGTLTEQLSAYLTRLHAAFVSEFTGFQDMLLSASTLSVTAIQGAYASCHWLGDSPIYATVRTNSDPETMLVSSPDIDPLMKSLTAVFTEVFFEPHRAQVRLEAGDALMIATDGLMYRETQISEIYKRQGVNQRAIDTMIAESILPRNSDDCTISVAHRTA